MSQRLAERRCQRIKPLFAHIAETVQLERFEDHSDAGNHDAAIVDQSRRLASMIRELDEQDRNALLAVIRSETSMLLVACMTHAAILRIQKQAGIATTEPSP